MTHSKKVLVIIVTYNGMKWIKDCLNSVLNSSIKTDISIFDNASTDNTPDYIKVNFPQITIISTGKNLGFGKANNLGLQKAINEGYDYAFLLNQDAYIETDTIKKLIQAQIDNPNFGIISPLHLNGKGDAIDQHFLNYISPSHCPSIISDAFLNNHKQIYETQNANAAAWLISRACIEKVGGFDPIFPHYGEDDDYVNRALFHGFKIGIIPKAIILHDRICASYNTIRKDSKRLVISNSLIIKHYPHPFHSNLLTFLKQQFDLFTSLILFRQFKELKLIFKAFIRTVMLLKKIRNSKTYFSKPNSSIILP